MKFRIFLILALFVVPAVAQQPTVKVEDCGAIDFKFLLAWNKATRSKGRIPGSRTVYLYMDAADVNETNLRKLFSWVSKTYPMPENLHVWVETKLADVPNPTEWDCEGNGRSGLPDNFGSKTVWATYTRTPAAEWFTFADDPQSQEIRRVDIRGKISKSRRN